MTRAEIVRAAIEFKSPPRVPIWFFNKDHFEGDILLYYIGLGAGNKNEWGYWFETLGDGTMGQPAEPVIPEWDDLANYTFPELRAEERLVHLPAFLKDAGDRYVMAGLGLSGFTLYTFLRGFENSMLDFAMEREKAEFLLDKIFEFETKLIEVTANAGLDGIHFSDDWGSQEGLVISPDMWRDLFKPRYAAQFRRAHELGLHVWFHCCGNIQNILVDFQEIGVDVMNISQPNAVDLIAAGNELRGRQCFMVPISYQTVSISGTPDEILAEARRMYDALASPEGGLIGYVEEYSCMGMTDTNYKACGEAFRRLYGSGK